METKIKLWLPLKQIIITQPFGVNFVDFYQKLGMKGHNGIDFGSNEVECYAAHSGEVFWAGVDGDGGVSVGLLDPILHFKTIYYHLKDVSCKVGDYVTAGNLIGHCDNTGLMTTGNHLHFGLKFLDKNNFNVLNYNNGYKGCVDPSPYFNFTYNGQEINPKDWDKSRCYHRYYRGRPKGGLINEVKVAGALTKYLKRFPKNEEINACAYGGWDRESLVNDSMRVLWSQLKKSEYLSGEKPVNTSMG